MKIKICHEKFWRKIALEIVQNSNLIGIILKLFLALLLLLRCTSLTSTIFLSFNSSCKMASYRCCQYVRWLQLTIFIFQLPFFIFYKWNIFVFTPLLLVPNVFRIMCHTHKRGKEHENIRASEHQNKTAPRLVWLPWELEPSLLATSYGTSRCTYGCTVTCTDKPIDHCILVFSAVNDIESDNCYGEFHPSDVLPVGVVVKRVRIGFVGQRILE